MTEPFPAEIAKALVIAQRATRAVEKGARAHQYMYASTETIIREARHALAEAGLALFQLSWSLEAGKDGEPPTLRTFYCLTHESGESYIAGPVMMPCISGKGRPEDKAVATGLTYTQGYFLRGLLNMPRVEKGTEVDDRDDEALQKHRAQIEMDLEAAEDMIEVLEGATTKSQFESVVRVNAPECVEMTQKAKGRVWRKMLKCGEALDYKKHEVQELIQAGIDTNGKEE